MRIKEIMNEATHVKYWYHGTSDKFLPMIKQNGLTASKNYITSSSAIAHIESFRTVNGDEWGNRKNGVGGNPVVIVLNADDPSILHAKLIKDDEYDDPELRAFYTKDKISPTAIVNIIDISKYAPIDYVIPKSYFKKLKSNGLINKNDVL